MNGVTYISHFLDDHFALFDFLKLNIPWDSRMVARKTASYGVSYNYSQIEYPFLAFIPELSAIATAIDNAIGFTPNSCLINYYLDGKSKMGYHSDQTDMLYDHTGIAIVSIGQTRTLRFRNINDKEQINDFELPSGSLIYMTQAVQSEWQHSIPPSLTNEGRMSLTFRKIKQ